APPGSARRSQDRNTIVTSPSVQVWVDSVGPSRTASPWPWSVGARRVAVSAPGRDVYELAPKRRAAMALAPRGPSGCPDGNCHASLGVHVGRGFEGELWLARIYRF